MLVPSACQAAKNTGDRSAPATRLLYGPAFGVLLCVLLASAAGAQAAPTLVIRNARVLDTGTATVRERMAIVITGDRITAVVPDSLARRSSRARVIDARGRLVTPAFIDVHHHVDMVFPDSVTEGAGAVAKFVMHPDSIRAYRARWAREYLPYGVTAVREVGGGERHMQLRLAWMVPSPSAPDFFTSGGAFVSPEEGRVPYLGHTVVDDSAVAIWRVRRYHAQGIRDIKLYWRLREPAFGAAFREARRLGMHVTAHVDYGLVGITRALQVGVRHFEHAFTIGTALLDERQAAAAWERTQRELEPRMPAAFIWGTLELLNMLGDAHPALARRVRELADAGATVTPTMHIFAQHVGVTWFATHWMGALDDSDAWTDAQRARALAGYERLEDVVLALNRAGVTLAVGTDTRYPGKAVLSEILLLERAGIPMAEALGIATLGGAKVLERERDYGAIEPGKKAHLVIFDRSPLDDSRAILGAKTVIKDGRVVPR